MTKQYFIYVRRSTSTYGELYVDVDGTAMSTNSVDMATTYARSLSLRFLDHVYVVLRYVDGLPHGSVGQSSHGNWENHSVNESIIPVANKSCHTV